MKILHVHGGIDPASGGPSSVVVNLAAAEARLGHEVALAVTCPPFTFDACGDAYRDVPALERVRLCPVSPVGPAGVLTGSAGDARLAALLQWSDAVHLVGFWEPVLLAAARGAARRGRPYFVMPNGMLEPWPMRQRTLKKHVALALGWRRLARRAAAVHVLNEDERQLSQWVAPDTPMRIVPNGVDLDRVDRSAARPANLPLPAWGPRYLIFVGRLHAVKGLDLLLQAFAAVAPRWPEVNLVLVGPDAGAEPDLRRTVAHLALTPRVHFTGPLYGDDKFHALRAAACFCLPSRQEGFSVAALEALACRLPLLATHASHAGELAAAGAALLCEGSVPALTTGLETILADPTRAAALAAAGRRLVEQRFTWTAVAQAATAMYQPTPPPQPPALP